MNTLRFRLLWRALMASLLVYVAVAHVAPVPPNPEAPLDVLTGVLALLAVALGAGSLLYRRRALSGPIRSGELDPRTPEGQQRAMQPFLVNLVLSESVGLYGLVLSLLSGDPVYATAFCAAALVLMFLHRPTAADLIPPQSGPLRGRDSTPIG